MTACGFDHHRAMASECSPSPGPTRCPSGSRPATPPGPGCWDSPLNVTTRPRTSATTSRVQGFPVRSSRSPTRTRMSRTFAHPIQSLVWDDFTAKPATTTRTSSIRWRARRRISTGHGRRSRSCQHRAAGRRAATTCSSTAAWLEPGVRAPVRQPVRPDEQPSQSKRRDEALQWLSRDLDEAMLALRRRAAAGDAVCCAASTSSASARPLTELAKAINRGVDVRLWSTAR